MPDAKSFPGAVGAFHARLVKLGRDLDSLTLVYDKGNVSRANQRIVDDAKLHCVASLTASNQRALVAEANANMECVVPDETAQKDKNAESFNTSRRLSDGSLVWPTPFSVATEA